MTVTVAVALSWGLLGNVAALAAALEADGQNVPTAPLPGVMVATLSLGNGRYIAYAKLRLRSEGSTSASASCLYQGGGIGGLDAAGPDNIAVEATATVSLMDMVRKQPDHNRDVHVRCFRPSSDGIHVASTRTRHP